MAETLVCDIQRFSIHDGPGIRTVLFFKGCNLRCRWCQNPETLNRRNEVLFSAERCIACGDCQKACDRRAIAFDRGPRIDPDRCDACLACAHACPARALEPAARPFTPQAALAACLADREFYEPEGGVTLSGGEPLLQHLFLAEFLPLLRAARLSVAVETAGFWDYDPVAPLLPFFDLILFDLKAADPALHRELTGADNRLILANLRRLLADGRPVALRMPAVPGLNTRPADLAAMAQLVKSLGRDALTLLPFHRLYEAKLKKFKSPIRPLGIPSPRPADLRAFADQLASHGVSAG